MFLWRHWIFGCQPPRRNSLLIHITAQTLRQYITHIHHLCDISRVRCSSKSWMRLEVSIGNGMVKSRHWSYIYIYIGTDPQTDWLTYCDWPHKQIGILTTHTSFTGFNTHMFDHICINIQCTWASALSTWCECSTNDYDMYCMLPYEYTYIC